MIGLNGGLNTYGYVSNSPISFFDPYGLQEYSDDFMGPLPPGGYRSSEMTMTECGPVPPGPSDSDIDENMRNAENRWNVFNPFWFYNQVRNGGPWDYKQQGPRYQDFGNFNYGAAGAANGFRDSWLRRLAGWANQRAGSGREHLGSPIGPYPYGDDPRDQEQIDRGIEFYRCRIRLNQC